MVKCEGLCRQLPNRAAAITDKSAFNFYLFVCLAHLISRLRPCFLKQNPFNHAKSGVNTIFFAFKTFFKKM